MDKYFRIGNRFLTVSEASEEWQYTVFDDAYNDIGGVIESTSSEVEDIIPIALELAGITPADFQRAVELDDDKVEEFIEKTKNHSGKNWKEQRRR